MWNIAPLVLSTILKDFFTSFIVESKILQNHWLRNYFVKLVERDECKIIGTCLMMFGRRIVEFLHKHTWQIFSLLTVSERWFLSLCTGNVWEPINQFNPATYLCLSQARTWISIVICCGLFLCSVSWDVRFVDISEIVDHHCLNFLFINSYHKFSWCHISDY